FLSLFLYNSQSHLTTGILGFDVSVLCSDYDAGADRYGNTSTVADSAVARNWRRDDRGIDLGGITHLSGRHVDVRKEGHDSGGLALDKTGLSIFDFLIADF